MEASWRRLGASWRRLGASWSRLGAVLDRLGGVLRCLGAFLKAIWPDTENVEKPLVFLAFWSLGRSWKRLRGLLERFGSVLKTSWSRLGATADVAAPAAAPDAVCVGVPAALGRSWTALEPLLGALGSITAFLRAFKSLAPVRFLIVLLGWILGASWRLSGWSLEIAELKRCVWGLVGGLVASWDVCGATDGRLGVELGAVWVIINVLGGLLWVSWVCVGDSWLLFGVSWGLKGGI